MARILLIVATVLSALSAVLLAYELNSLGPLAAITFAWAVICAWSAVLSMEEA